MVTDEENEANDEPKDAEPEQKNNESADMEQVVITFFTTSHCSRTVLQVPDILVILKKEHAQCSINLDNYYSMMYLVGPVIFTTANITQMLRKIAELKFSW